MTAIVARYLDGSEHSASVPIAVGGQYPEYILLYANRLEHPKVLRMVPGDETAFVPHYDEVSTALGRLDEGGK